MKKYEVLNPLAIGGSRQAKGTIVELSEEVAKAYDVADLKLVQVVEATETTEEKAEIKKSKKIKK